MKEAVARIKINKLLEAAVRRFFPKGGAPADTCLEPTVAIKSADLNTLGENFEKAERGLVDLLLLDSRGFPLVVLEAKSEAKNPLTGKEPVRRYARSQNCRFVIRSNGNRHCFWDLERGNPHIIIISFPTSDSITGYQHASASVEAPMARARSSARSCRRT
jgi:type I restriction enzyme R subunit